MPHLSLISLSGFRIHEEELLRYGMTLPGFHERANALAELPALGLLTLAGLTPEHWSMSYQAPQQVTQELIEQLVNESPTLVAISALTASIEEAYQLSDALRGRGIQTALGGLHVTACPEEARQHADTVLVGAGESIWQQVLDDAERHQLKPAYHAAESTALSRHTQWPTPRYDLLGNVKRYTLQTQRGCPFACDFCAASRLLGRFSEKPAEQIRQELNLISSLSSRTPILLELADDNTFAGGRDFNAFFDVFSATNVRWFTENDWRLGERPELLSRLAAAGCVQVLIGIESMVFRYPGMGRKQAELNRMMDAVVAIQEAGVAVNGCFIVGAEGETHESLDRMTEFLLNSPFAEVQVTVQTPYPGTALRKRLQQQGRLLPDRGWPYYSLFEVTYQPDRLSVHELEQRFREMVTHVYGASATHRRKQLRLNIWRNNPAFRTSSAQSRFRLADDADQVSVR